MAEQLYRIKPLEWTEAKDMIGADASSVGGYYYTHLSSPGLCVTGEVYLVFVSELDDERIQDKPFPSMEEAKAACQSHHASRMLAGLLPVGGE